MNILLVTETYVPTISGVASSTESIAKYMVSRGYTVTVVCPAPFIGGSTGAPLKGLTVVTTPSNKDPVFAGKPMTVFPMGLRTIWQTLHGQKFDIIHIQEPGSLGISTLLISKVMHIPTVGAQHTMPEQMATFFGPLYRFGLQFAKFWDLTIYKHYDAIMTPTETMADYLKSIGIRVPITAVSNGIETKKYFPAKPDVHLRTPYRLPKGKICIGYLGRIDKDKHLDITVRAMKYTDPGVHLVIAGFGKELTALVALAHELGVTDKVTFIGSLNEPQIIELYHRLQCFIIPSPVESQSIVTLQAAACGLPLIAADAGALPELVHDGVNGYLVKTDDVRAFAKKMNDLAKSETLRSTFGAASRKISLLHDKPLVLHKLENLYGHVLRARKSS